MIISRKNRLVYAREGGVFVYLLSVAGEQSYKWMFTIMWLLLFRGICPLPLCCVNPDKKVFIELKP